MSGDDANSFASSQQTRFSFYNAEDFKVVSAAAAASPTKQQASSITASSPTNTTVTVNSNKAVIVANSSANTVNANNNKDDAAQQQQQPSSAALMQLQQQHFSYYNADDSILTRAVVQTVQAQAAAAAAAEQQQQDAVEVALVAAFSDDDDDTNINNLDSGDILKSLQEHEQQRLEILAGPMMMSSSSSNGKKKQGNKLKTTATAVLAKTASAASKSSGSRSSNSSSAQNSLRNSHHNNSYHTTATAVTGNGAAAAAAVSSGGGGYSSGENSNPYEDAIKEALQLLRRHRSASLRISAPQQQQQQPVHEDRFIVTTKTAAANNNTNTGPPPLMEDADLILDRLESNDLEEQQQQSLQRKFQDLMIRTARSPPAIGAPMTAPNRKSRDLWEDSTLQQQQQAPLDASADAVAVAGQLGEAYQAEIEARRKQRQERMARYASRLAELKQNDDSSINDHDNNNDGPPAVDTARSLDSSVDYNNGSAKHIGIARGSSHPQRRPWNNINDDDFDDDNDSNPGIALSKSWDDDAIVMSRSADLFAAVVAPDLSNAGSMSTLSNTNKQEDEVQRGVERVLLAILERANSRGRTATSLQENNINGIMFATAPQQQPPPNLEFREALLFPATAADEEKKSSAEDSGGGNAVLSRPPVVAYSQQDDALLRAMSDLLGPTTRSRPSGAVNTVVGCGTTEDEDDPSTSLATQEEPTALFATAVSHCDDVDDVHNVFPSVIVAEDDAYNSNGIGNEASSESHDSNGAAPYEMDRMVVEQIFRPDEKVIGNNNGKGNISGPLPEDDPVVAPVETMSSFMNVDTSCSSADDDDIVADSSSDDREDVDERNRSSDHSSDGMSSSNFDGDDTVEDVLDVATGADNDADSKSSDDDDDSSGDDYDSDEANARYTGVLGPLSKRSGGTTGVVLDDKSSSSTSSDDEEVDDPRNNRTTLSGPSILESFTAAVSMVTGITPIDDKQVSPQLSRKDRYALDQSKSDGDSDVDSEANGLMRSLCAHLLPVGVDQPGRLLDKAPDWDESNPDEAGYRIVRLNSLQLRRVQKEYDRMVESLKQKSQRNLSPIDARDESAFERDLRDAEDLLDQEEKRLKTAEKVPGANAKTSPPTSPNGGNLIQAHGTSNEDGFAVTKLAEPECLPGFSGVKPAGKGEMGELEYFTLPIIFKSHVTGFEPTKDLMLEPGNVVAGQYLVEGVLGSAAFSTAYKCVDLNSEEDSSGCQDLVCLKIIKNTKDFFDQSLDEIKILELLRQTGKCNENFIVEMKTFFYHREHLVIVTELLRQNLFEFGKFIVDSGEEPYFTITRLSYITWQCLIALNFVHGIGLVHSDVKPENILLASYSRAQAKLIDFGSSCYLTDRQSSYIQSRSYRAPEVVLGLPYDGRIDIWSLGCVVAEMFTGEVTFQNDSIVSMLSRIEAICGPFPQHMVAQGRQSSRFFTKCGLLFEKVAEENSGSHDSCSGDSSNDDDENRKPAHIDIFQPKRTTLAARLGFAPDLMKKFDSGKTLPRDEKRQALFCDLVRKLLTIDPEIRPTAAEALDHPAMLYAATLTEADIKYPSS